MRHVGAYDQPTFDEASAIRALVVISFLACRVRLARVAP
jgi:hypothetical protein